MSLTSAPVPAPDGTPATPTRPATARPVREALREVATRPAGIAGAVLTCIVVVAAVFAPVIAPHPPLYQFPDGLRANGSPVGPNATFLLGTDALGRDEFSRLLWGLRETLEVSVTANIIAALIGVAVGCLAGYYGGWLDAILMRITEVLIAIPAILLAAFLAIVIRPSLATLILIVGGVSWFYLAKIVRAEVLSIRQREFVSAAKLYGAGSGTIMFVHVLRQVWSLVIVYTTLQLSDTATFVSAMSFVGVGIQPPTPSLGDMIADGSRYLESVPRLAIVPGVALGLVVLGFNLLGDSLHDAMEKHA
jgi:peptide/nickel transport system permease protein